MATDLRLKRAALAHAGATLAVSEAIAAELRGAGLPRVQVVPNIVDAHEAARVAEAPPSFPLPERFVLFVGKLEENKGARLLVPALAASGHKLPLVVLGTEPAPPPPPPPGPWQRARAWIAEEFGELVRINEVATPEALLLSSEQGRLVRQHLKLRLLGARIALLARSDKLFHSDIDSAQTLLALYFDGRHAAVANAAATLRQLNTAMLALEVPALADSQAAVRAARARQP